MRRTLESGTPPPAIWWRHGPPTGVAGAVFWLALWFALLWLIRLAIGGATLLGWMQVLVGVSLVVLALPLAWRLLQARLLWSLRSKLVLTYLLIGLAPVILFVTLVGISAYIAAGQFSIHLADTRLRQEVTEMATDNSTRAVRLARFLSIPPIELAAGERRFRRPGAPARSRNTSPSPRSTPAPAISPAPTAPGESFRDRLHRQTTAYLNGVPLAQSSGALGAGVPGTELTASLGSATTVSSAGGSSPSPATPEASARTPLGLPAWAADLPRKEFRGLVLDGNDLYLVAINQHVIEGGPHHGQLLSVITSLPVDSALLDVTSQGLGRIRMAAVMTGITQLPRPPNPSALRRTPNRTPLPAGDTTLARARDRQADAAKTAGRKILGDDLLRTSVYGGTEPTAVNFADIRVPFVSTEPITDWVSGVRDNAPIEVDSRPSLLYRQLFGSSLSGIITSYIRNGLIALCIVFAFIELLALWMAIRLSRTITSSVAGLYEATQRVDRGDLQHRLAMVTKDAAPDQLGELRLSFNRMTASLARLLDEQKEKERLQSELTIAQEVQANLFPHAARSLPTLELHGICRPARTVSGDYYDFLVFHHQDRDGGSHNGAGTAPAEIVSLAADPVATNGNGALRESGVGIVLGDISGKGISAALLMATLHSAVRAYRFASEDLVYSETTLAGVATVSDTAPREGLGGDSGKLFESPGRILSLLNRHLFRSTQPEKYATLFLAHYDATSSRLTYSNAGHLPPLVLSRDGQVRRLDRGGTVVGLMDNMRYEEGHADLRSGDILIAYSDGVTEPENDFGEFGEERLLEVVARYRDQPLHIISAQVMLALDAWIGAVEQPDDITLVLARQL